MTGEKSWAEMTSNVSKASPAERMTSCEAGHTALAGEQCHGAQSNPSSLFPDPFQRKTKFPNEKTRSQEMT